MIIGDSMKLTDKSIRDLVGTKMFSVKFTKKDGTKRTMLCRLKTPVWKGEKRVNGVGMSYDPKNYNLLTVFDVNKEGYRMVNLNTLEELKFKGITYANNKEEK